MERRSRTAPIPGVEGTFIHPFDDHNFIAGHGSIGLEILEDEPATRAVIGGIGGGGLITGVGSAIKALRPDIKVFGVEPDTAAPAALSKKMGSPQLFKDWQASFVDGAGGQSMFPRMWERIEAGGRRLFRRHAGGNARRDAHPRREGARDRRRRPALLSVAAALSGKAGDGPVVAIISGGNIDLKKFCELVAE